MVKELKRYLRDVKGFTLIELVLVVASIAILAAILVATILGILDDARTAKHKADVKSIAAAVVKFDDDVGEFPTRNSEADSETNLLYSGTTAPGTDFAPAGGGPTASNPTAVGLSSFACETIAGGSAGHCESFEFPFVTNTTSGTGVAYETSTTKKKRWKGPYLSENTQDEFGKPYIVYVRRLRRTGAVTTERAWIVAAGANKIYQTTPGSTSACAGNSDCDDIVFLIK